MPLFDVIDLFDDETARSGAEQMALDEALLEIAQRPLLRVYRWAEPTVSFGYSLPLASVRDRFPALPCVRRWTGRRNRGTPRRLDVRSTRPLERTARQRTATSGLSADPFRRGGGAHEDRLRGTSGRTARLRGRPRLLRFSRHCMMSSASVIVSCAAARSAGPVEGSCTREAFRM